MRSHMNIAVAAYRAVVPALFACLLLTHSGAPAATSGEPSGGAARETPMEHAAKHLDPKYVCPMHPQIVKDEPGSCPICGMDLVQRPGTTAAEQTSAEPEKSDHRGPAMEKSGSTGEQPAVGLSGALTQSMGVRTTLVEKGDLSQEIRTLGRVEYDETRIAHVHPKAEGWIEDLALRAEGEPVSKGQELAQLYAPDILSAQVDFLLSLKPRAQGVAGVKADKARNLLRLLDVPDSMIREIERTGDTSNTVPVLAPIDGIVTRMMAREGMYVGKDTEMFTIADLSRVWVLVDVFEHQIEGVEVGQEAEIKVPAHPGRGWSGKVDYLYPDLDPKTRTLRIRLVFENPNLELKPNMFAEVVIHGDPKRDRIRIPREALIVTGERESVVKVVGDGRFQPVNVVTGARAGDRVEILSGLRPGDEIVVSGQFLIDSESSLQASFMRLSEPADQPGQAPPDARSEHVH